MNRLRIQHSRRAPFIGPRRLIQDRHIFAFAAIMTAAFAVAYLITWLCIELKKLF